jgi:hypothetical protein
MRCCCDALLVLVLVLVLLLRRLYWCSQEVDPTMDTDSVSSMLPGQEASFIQDIGMSIPGIDEAMSFAEVMKYAASYSLDAIEGERCWRLLTPHNVAVDWYRPWSFR